MSTWKHSQIISVKKCQGINSYTDNRARNPVQGKRAQSKSTVMKRGFHGKIGTRGKLKKKNWGKITSRKNKNSKLSRKALSTKPYFLSYVMATPQIRFLQLLSTKIFSSQLCFISWIKSSKWISFWPKINLLK